MTVNYLSGPISVIYSLMVQYAFFFAAQILHLFMHLAVILGQFDPLPLSRMGLIIVSQKNDKFGLRKLARHLHARDSATAVGDLWDSCSGRLMR